MRAAALPAPGVQFLARCPTQGAVPPLCQLTSFSLAMVALRLLAILRQAVRSDRRGGCAQPRPLEPGFLPHVLFSPGSADVGLEDQPRARNGARTPSVTALKSGPASAGLFFCLRRNSAHWSGPGAPARAGVHPRRNAPLQEVAASPPRSCSAVDLPFTTTISADEVRK